MDGFDGYGMDMDMGHGGGHGHLAGIKEMGGGGLVRRRI
jgi:hypothetical protein